MLPLGYIAPEWLLLINIYWAIALPSNKKSFWHFYQDFL
jgi:cell shape-determining protein MreD